MSMGQIGLTHFRQRGFSAKGGLVLLQFGLGFLAVEQRDCDGDAPNASPFDQEALRASCLKIKDTEGGLKKG